MNLRWIGTVERWAEHPSAPWLLAAIAFADSSFLPIPPDILLVPMVLLQPARVWPLSILCTVSAAIGSLLGYGIGAGLWHAVGERIVAFYGWSASFAQFQALFADWGVWIIIGKALTPIPFKVAAIASGLAGMDIWVFIGAALVSRALHFLILALLLAWLGPRVMDAIQKYETRAAVVGAVVVAVTVIYVSVR